MRRLLWVGVLLPALALADPVKVNVGAQPMSSALNVLAEQIGIQLVYDGELVSGLRAPALAGVMEPTAALESILAGSGLTYRYTSQTTVTLEKIPASKSTRRLGPVRVEGKEESRTPSRSDATTERTDSYASLATTVSGGQTMSLMDFPNSVTVVTREQMDDRGYISGKDALLRAPGVFNRDQHYTNDIPSRPVIRGFDAQIEIDGVTRRGDFFVYSPDLAGYDRVEVRKGPDGLFMGRGNSGGTINYVHKRALREFAISAQTQVGEWDYFRQELDVTGPIAFDGRVRGRVAGAINEAGSFVPYVENDNEYLYATIEAEPLENLVFSYGVELQDFSGVSTPSHPQYSDFTIVPVARDRFYGAPWARFRRETDERHYAARYSVGEWLKVDFTHREFINGAPLNTFLSLNNVNPTTHIGSVNISREGQQDDGRESSLKIETKFPVFGREQRVTLAADKSAYWAMRSDYTGRSTTTTFNVFAYDPTSIPEPSDEQFALRGDSSDQRRDAGVTLRLTLDLHDRLTALLGARYSKYEFNQRLNYADNPSNFYRTFLFDSVVKPDFGLVYKPATSLSVYASYSDIYTPSRAVDKFNQLLPQPAGQQYELGVRKALRDDRLVASLAAFEIRERNKPFTDPTDTDGIPPRGQIAIGLYLSRGVELQVTGEVANGFDLSAGYTYNDISIEDDINPLREGVPFIDLYPTQMLKAWGNYRIGQGALRGLEVGLGADYQSAVVRATVTNSVSRENSERKAFVNGFARVAYTINEHFDLQLNVTNLLNAGPHTGYGYLPPRRAVLALQTRF